jgi:hypothetical protein
VSADEVIRHATAPDGDIACDFAMAVELRRTGFRERLAASVVGEPREIAGGIEAAFRADAWDLVLRYIEVESQCCPFLDLAARREAGRVLLRVTGREDAQGAIREIFRA